MLARVLRRAAVTTPKNKTARLGPTSPTRGGRTAVARQREAVRVGGIVNVIVRFPHNGHSSGHSARLIIAIVDRGMAFG